MGRDRCGWRERSPSPKHSPPTKPPRRHVVMNFGSPVRETRTAPKRFWLPPYGCRRGMVVMSADLILARCSLSRSASPRAFSIPSSIPALQSSTFSLDDFTIVVAMDPFPEVQGGGSLILAWQIRNKRVLVVGGGEVSDRIIPITTSHP